MTITHPAYRRASKEEKGKEENSSITVLASIPSYRFEEVRTAPVIRRPILERRP
jgi:hypothetical protein